jgi:hypothetical protein
MAAAPTAATQPQAAQLLVLLYQYVKANAPSHPVLLPAVLSLREAARLYGRNDVQLAFERGVAVFRLLQQARTIFPDLPIP